MGRANKYLEVYSRSGWQFLPAAGPYHSMYIHGCQLLFLILWGQVEQLKVGT